MIKSISQQVTFDGFEADDTDFAARFAAAPEDLKDLFDNEIFQPIIEVLATADQAAALTIEGAADRVDLAGLAADERRARERQASEARAASAEQVLNNAIAEVRNEVPPVDLAARPQLSVLTVGVGAARLVVDVANPSEADRKKNRAVVFVLVRFFPG